MHPTTTNDILFLKRLRFLKAALDNDQSVSNFAVPFEEDKAFTLQPNEAKPAILNNDARTGLSTAPAGGNGKRQRQVFSLEDDPEERPLALTNGGINDDLNDTQPQMKALFNPPADGGRNHKLPPKTATTGRARQNSKRAGNSLNLHAATT